MIVKEILGNINNIDNLDKKELVNVTFDWFETDKKRIFKVADDGIDIGIQLDKKLQDGDILYQDSDRVYIVKINDSELTYIKIHSIIEMGRLCFELGNRHLSLKIEDNGVYTPFDKPTFEYLEKCGFQVQKIMGIFNDFIECKAHGSSNTHEHHHDHSHSHN